MIQHPGGQQTRDAGMREASIKSSPHTLLSPAGWHGCQFPLVTPHTMRNGADNPTTMRIILGLDASTASSEPESSDASHPAAESILPPAGLRRHPLGGGVRPELSQDAEHGLAVAFGDPGQQLLLEPPV
jgi:hypothetical protein